MLPSRCSLSKITLQIVDHLSIWNFSFSKKEQIIQSYVFPTNCIFVVLKVRCCFYDITISILGYNWTRLYLLSPWEWILFLNESCRWIPFFCLKDWRKNRMLVTWNVSQWGSRRKREDKWLLWKGKFNVVMKSWGKKRYIKSERSFDSECEEITY